MSIERRPGLLVRRAVEKFRSFARGYSPDELANARRFIAGNIQPEDRMVFRTDEISRLTQMATTPRPINSPDDLGISSMYSPYLSEALKEIEKLPDDEVDKRIQSRAKENLQRWKQLP